MAKSDFKLSAELSLNTLGFAAGIGAAIKGLSSLAGGVKQIVTSAVSNYAEFEQLEGGVQTLFGAGGKTLEEYAASVGKSVEKASAEYDQLMTAQQAVLDNADNAWMTAGMSANEYMNTVTGFAASLKQSTKDSTEAAAVADMALQDMADNANKFGTNMDAVTTAYQGFAKQNYTMLDNLKLGYGGTKQEMMRLLSDANKINAAQGKATYYSINNLSDIYEAIHTVQTELGVTGTTADEAQTTISGSLGMMKASWTNLMTALGRGEGIDTAIDNLVFSAKTFAGNIMPVISNALAGLGSLVSDLVPIIAAELPALASALLPEVMTAVSGLVDGLMQAMPGLLQAAGDMLPLIIPMVTQMLSSLTDFITQNAGQLASSGLALITGLINAAADAIPQILPMIPAIILGIADGLLTAVDENIDSLLDAAIRILEALIDGMINSFATVAEKLPEIIMKIVETLLEHTDDIIQAGVDLLAVLIDDTPAIIAALATGLWDVVSGIGEYFGANTQPIEDGFSDMWEKVKEWFSKLDVFQIGADIVNGISDGIDSAIGWIGDKASQFTNWITGKDKETETTTTETTPVNEGLEKTAGAASDAAISTSVIVRSSDLLKPVDQAVIDSWYELRDAIAAVKAILTGAGEEGAEGAAAPAAEGAAGEGGAAGLVGIFQQITDGLGQMLTAVQNLAEELSGNFVTALKTASDALAVTSTDEEGNVSAGKGNTLYTAMGAVKGVFEDLLAACREIADMWTGRFIDAVESMKTAAGEAEGAAESLTETAYAASDAYAAWAGNIQAVIAGLEDLAGMDTGGTGTGGATTATDGARASGGPVARNHTYLVGEEGPELFTPNRSGAIINTDDLRAAAGNGETVINVTFSGDVIGDERSIRSLVERAVKAGIRQEVRSAI